jgi:glycosyltransferase involved in cell wall biosynthesis
MILIFISVSILLFLFIVACALLAWTSITIPKRTEPQKHTPIHPDQKLTIFLVTNNYTPFSGGVVSAIDSYAQELRLLGHRAIIITLNFTGSQLSENDVIRLWCPIRFLYRANHMALPWRPTAAIEQLALQYKPDIIHTYHPMLLGASALKVGKKLHIPVVFSYMTLYDRYLHYIPLLPQFLTKPIINYLVHDFCAKVDALVVPGNSIKEYIHAQGVERDIQVIPLSILPIFIHDVFTPKKSNPQERAILLCVSRFAPEKNLYFLLDMFKQLEPNHFRLVLIGFGKLEEALKQYAYETLKLTHEDVVFIIQPTKQELCDWYEKAFLFVFASLSETQGLVVAEALASGTPVVALRAPGIEDVVMNDENGYLVHSNEEMISTIHSMREHPQLYAKLSQHAWRTAQNYCPKKRALKLIELYTRLM